MTDNSIEAYLFFGSRVFYHKCLELSIAILWGESNDNITVSFHKLTKEISFRHHFKICHSANNTTKKRWLTTYEYLTVTKETVYKYSTFIIVANDEFCYIKKADTRSGTNIRKPKSYIFIIIYLFTQW